MEQTPLPPLVSEPIVPIDPDKLFELACEVEISATKEWRYGKGGPLTASMVEAGLAHARNIYEADRQRTREVVQALVDALERTLDPTSFAMTQARLPITKHEYRRALQQGNQAISSAKSQLNIEPTKQ